MAAPTGRRVQQRRAGAACTRWTSDAGTCLLVASPRCASRVRCSSRRRPTRSPSSGSRAAATRRRSRGPAPHGRGRQTGRNDRARDAPSRDPRSLGILRRPRPPSPPPSPRSACPAAVPSPSSVPPRCSPCACCRWPSWWWRRRAAWGRAGSGPRSSTRSGRACRGRSTSARSAATSSAASRSTRWSCAGAEDSLFVAIGRVFARLRRARPHRPARAAAARGARPARRAAVAGRGRQWNYKRVFRSDTTEDADEAPTRGFGDFIVADSVRHARRIVRADDAVASRRTRCAARSATARCRVQRSRGRIARSAARGERLHADVAMDARLRGAVVHARWPIRTPAGRRFVIERVDMDESDPPFQLAQRARRRALARRHDLGDGAALGPARIDGHRAREAGVGQRPARCATTCRSSATRCRCATSRGSTRRCRAPAADG